MMIRRSRAASQAKAENPPDVRQGERLFHGGDDHTGVARDGARPSTASPVMITTAVGKRRIEADRPIAEAQPVDAGHAQVNEDEIGVEDRAVLQRLARRLRGEGRGDRAVRASRRGSNVHPRLVVDDENEQAVRRRGRLGLRVMGFTGGDRDQHGEARTARLAAVEPDGAAMQFHHRLADRQADAGADPRAGLVVKSGSKMRPAMASGTPGPLSETTSRTWPFLRRVEMVTRRGGLPGRGARAGR